MPRSDEFVDEILSRIADGLVKELMDMPDEEVLAALDAELAAQGKTREDFRHDMDAIFERAKTQTEFTRKDVIALRARVIIGGRADTTG